MKMITPRVQQGADKREEELIEVITISVTVKMNKLEQIEPYKRIWKMVTIPQS